MSKTRKNNAMSRPLGRQVIQQRKAEFGMNRGVAFNGGQLPDVQIYKSRNLHYYLLFSLSVVSDSLRPPRTAAHQASLSFTISWSLSKLTSNESVIPYNHLILCCPLFLLPSTFSRIRVFFNELALCICWPKYWSFSFSISPSNEYLGLISFKIGWFDLLAVQGV